MPGWLLRFKSLLFETRPTVNTERVPRLPLKVWLPQPRRPRPADALQTGVAFARAGGEPVSRAGSPRPPATRGQHLRTRVWRAGRGSGPGPGARSSREMLS